MVTSAASESAERSEWLERSESKIIGERCGWRNDNSVRSLRVWWRATKLAGVSWRERVSVSRIVERVEPEVLALIMRDLTEARVCKESDSERQRICPDWCSISCSIQLCSLVFSFALQFETARYTIICREL